MKRRETNKRIRETNKRIRERQMHCTKDNVKGRLKCETNHADKYISFLLILLPRGLITTTAMKVKKMIFARAFYGFSCSTRLNNLSFPKTAIITHSYLMYQSSLQSRNFWAKYIASNQGKIHFSLLPDTIFIDSSSSFFYDNSGFGDVLHVYFPEK